jgi:hypothetical protein
VTGGAAAIAVAPAQADPAAYLVNVTAPAQWRINDVLVTAH